jgi:hypothetical protein
MFRITRRGFIGWGAGLAASSFLPPLRAASARRRKARGVIWLWMSDGMTPTYTWDPKPGTPLSPLPASIDTSVPDARIAEHLPICAAQMHRLAVIRSMTHLAPHLEEATRLLHVGTSRPSSAPEPPSLGAIIARELGDPDLEIPGHLVLDVPEIGECAVLGAGTLPFRLHSLEHPILNLRRNVASERDRNRSELLAEQDREWSSLRQQRAVEVTGAGSAQARAIMNSRRLKAFLLQEEPQALRDDYGPGFGEKCLLARRLVEAGVPFVEIGLSGWANTPRRWGDPAARARELDRGLGTLVGDLADRDALRDVVVVCAAPYGLPPPGAGADLYATRNDGYSVVLAGGWLDGGVIVGETGPDGGVRASPVTVGQFHATVLAACGIDWETRYSLEGRAMRYVPRVSGLPPVFSE